MRIARTVALLTSALVSAGIASPACGCHQVRRSLSTARRLERLPADVVALVQRFALSGTQPAATAPSGVPVIRCGVDEAFSASARYIAPLSRFTYPSFRASREAIVLLPAPAGPSMAIVSLRGAWSSVGCSFIVEANDCTRGKGRCSQCAAAAGDEFRTAPLWGLGQRIFFLHDGRTADLVKAITAHSSPGNGHYPDSEANAVIDNFKKLPVQDQQDLLNFLRSL